MDKFTQVLTPFGEPQRPELLTHVEQLLAEHYSCSRDQAVCGAEGLGTEDLGVQQNTRAMLTARVHSPGTGGGSPL